MTPLGPYHAQRLREMHERGATLVQAAQEFGRHVEHVARFAHGLGLHDWPRLSPEQQAAHRRLLDQTHDLMRKTLEVMARRSAAESAQERLELRLALRRARAEAPS